MTWAGGRTVQFCWGRPSGLCSHRDTEWLTSPARIKLSRQPKIAFVHLFLTHRVENAKLGESCAKSLFWNTLLVTPYSSKTEREIPSKSLIPIDRGVGG